MLLYNTGDFCPICEKRIVIPHLSELRDTIICTLCSNIEITNIAEAMVISDGDHLRCHAPENTPLG
jgi:hypothetical protein